MKKDTTVDTAIKISLIANIIVLLPVCTILLLNQLEVDQVFGYFTPARGILLSIYLSILISSIILFFKRDPKLVAPLLFVQVVYKITTPLTVGDMSNPAVISNLIVAAIHIATLYLIIKESKNLFRESF